MSKYTTDYIKIYRANIIFTPRSDRFEVIPHGYVAVGDGKVEGVYSELPQHLSAYPVTDYGDRLLIPAMNDMHVHAPQYRNQGIAMDLELLPWPAERWHGSTICPYSRTSRRTGARKLW